LNSPQSLSRPHPPIVIGGSGERKTLRLVARYADACNLFPGPEIRHKLDILRAHCDAEGRDYAAIEKSSMYTFDVGDQGQNVERIIEDLRLFAGLGIQKVHAGVSQPYSIKALEIIAERILPVAAEL
jgi:alkanesulfonate monooxygenase SsuD/methylene tetrahydromethanopterin reductase-like flavin-dependent oxidoreductase (luciferase family)